MKWNGRYYRPGYGIPVYPKKQDNIKELLKPLSEKTDKGNVWVPILNQPINVLKTTSAPVSSQTPTPTQTFTPTPTPSFTPTLTPTMTLTPTPSQITYYILAETNDILQAENNDLIEYEH
jgi:hypothetical protein